MQLALNELHILKMTIPIVSKIARYSTVIHESGSGAEHYMKSRHVYPPELFRYVVSLSAIRQKAWDVGTGTGQVAIGLSPHYNKVIATDISEQQLRHAQPEKNITYLKLPAELTDENIRIHAEHFPRGEIDAITCGTSAHFFDMEKFGRAASQLLRKRTGIVAIFCTVFPLLGDEMNGVFRDLVRDTLHLFKGPTHVLRSYATLEFPFQEFPAPRASPELMIQYRRFCTTHENFNIIADAGSPGQTVVPSFFSLKSWHFQDLMGWLESNRFAVGDSAMDNISRMAVPKFKNAWEQTAKSLNLPPEAPLDVLFPIYLRLGIHTYIG